MLPLKNIYLGALIVVMVCETASGLLSPRLSFHYTHLEVNSQLWRCECSTSSSSLSLLVDPLVGQLDFGLPPGIYKGRPRVFTDPNDAIRRMVDAAPVLG